jgi:O-antigen ligase
LIGYLAVVGATVTIVVTAVRRNDGALPVRAHPTIVLPLVVLWLVFVAVALVHPSLAALKRAPAFVVFSAAFVLIVPAVLPIEAFGRASAYLGAVATLLSVPGVLTGQVLFGLVEVSRGSIVPTAGFNTQNHLALLTLFGTLAGAAVLWRTYSRSSSALLGSRSELARRYDHWLAIAVVLCAIGLSLSRGRAALGTFVLAVALAGVYRLGDWRGFAATALTVAGAAATGILVAVFAPDLIAATGVSLTNRTGIWSATVRAIAARPLVGWGFVNPVSVLSSIAPSVSHSFHNSYLRMFFVGGIVGGVAYLAFLAGVLWCAVATLRAPFPREYALSRAAIPVAVLLFAHVFAGETIFGLSLGSVLSAVFVGYTQPTAAQRTLQLPTVVQQWARQRHVRLGSSND